ncbi:type I pullulanase [Paenibacillus sanguinis]|uniref:type I pullulanase n=1 Tax=Paenibacillus sanguinis TaxID=225906 RepID=UPI00035DC5A6|nr:type I pullulanase [Paenibacillus sanguinis]
MDYGDPAVTDGISVFDALAFDQHYFYDGNDLGAVYTPEQTRFRLWAPTASEARVVLYISGEDESASEMVMQRDIRGTWTLAIAGDYRSWLYTYRVRIGSQWNEAVDPYARAVAVNGEKAAILDLKETDPPGWEQDLNSRPTLLSPVDAVFYELHVRDASVHPESGIRHKGKFLGLCEKGTRSPQGIATGLDHIVSLGVTHVQLLPVFDYAKESIDEEAPDDSRYNWGYDPHHYNVPEGSYATDPYVPTVRIAELKRCIQELHASGLRVVMDVVYNHVYDGYLIHFSRLVPGYYLRYRADGTLSNGSACGNECATQRPMMSKYIVDSVLYWAREYHIDGFRFDLMGLMDITTMREIRRRLDELAPSLLMIGEGWQMETVLPQELQANQSNAAKLPGIGMFNDGLRDAIKGPVFHAPVKGFVSGAEGCEEGIKCAVVGGIFYEEAIQQFAQSPAQSVNFAECHDNHTLWDKLALSVPDATEEERRDMHRLASAIVLTSQGIPFLHAGQEFMRTKGGVENSYQSSVEINWLDWRRCAERQDDVSYMRSLIALRRSHPAFRLRTAEEIRARLRFEAAPARAVAFTLRDHAGGDPDRHLYVLYNARPGALSLELPALGPWEVRFGGEHVLALLNAGASAPAAGELLQLPLRGAAATGGAAEAPMPRLEVRGIGIVVLAVAR